MGRGVAQPDTFLFGVEGIRANHFIKDGQQRRGPLFNGDALFCAPQIQQVFHQPQHIFGSALNALGHRLQFFCLNRLAIAQHFVHQFGVADDVGDGVFQIMRHNAHEIILDRDQRFDAALLQHQHEVRLHAGVNFFQLKGLGDVIHPACAEGLQLVVNGIQRADEDYRDGAGARVCLELLAHFKAVHARHLNIQQDEIRQGFLGDRNRQFAADGRAHLVLILGEHGRQHAEVGRVVVNDENAGRCGHRASPLVTLSRC